MESLHQASGIQMVRFSDMLDQLPVKRQLEYWTIFLVFWSWRPSEFRADKVWYSEESCMEFFYVSPPKESTFCTTIFGLYFSHHIKFTDYIFSCYIPLWAAFVYCINTSLSDMWVLVNRRFLFRLP